MPPFPSPATGQQRESYTQMGPEHDLESIGKHCQFEYCHQLDFLPFRCESCKKTYCLDHRTETAHKCPNAGEWAAARRRKEASATSNNNNNNRMLSPSTLLPNSKPTIYNSAQCSHPKCKTLIHTLQNPGVHCQNCNRHYCLSHRLREDHDCTKLIPLGARPVGGKSVAQTNVDKARSAFSKLRAWGKDKSSSVTANLAPKPKPPSSAATRIANLNALKRSAKGDSNLDASKRFYLHVEASADTTKSKFPSGDFYFDSSWSVGRVLDDAAKRFQVQNVNNRVEGEDERLRVFHVEGGRLLDFSEKIGNCKVAQGDTIVLLRGVGPPIPDLIEA
ncbi:Zfand1 protein [Coccidioides immitis H538.4]|uniref:Zfand1 protein n=1 Tax=Coccidioides immitis H538.4 TaxID=396776 RepID=A0A0J8S4T9_COCIT|nr:Zfand1 protein [Coccidioides immitis H538.4]